MQRPALDAEVSLLRPMFCIAHVSKCLAEIHYTVLLLKSDLMSGKYSSFEKQRRDHS